MRTWVEKEGMITADDIAMLTTVKRAIDLLPDIPLGTELSCHILARAVRNVFTSNMEVESGYFYPSFQHSWLRLPSKNILDVYPVGIVGGPILVKAGWALDPGDRLYKVEEIRECTPAFDDPVFGGAVELVSSALTFITNPRVPDHPIHHFLSGIIT
jgi:hypothetical protein